MADYVGLKAGSLYHHIDSKQSLLYELMEGAISELLYCTPMRLSRKARAHERLECFIDTFLSFKGKFASRISMLSREQINLTSEQTHEFSGLKNEYIQILSDIIEVLIKSSPPQPLILAMAADAVIGMHFGQVQWLNSDVSGSQQKPILKRFAHGIIATINFETT